MSRILRPGSALTMALLLGLSGAAHGADYLLDSQVRIGETRAPNQDASPSDYDAVSPAIAVAPDRYRTLVVWSADDAIAADSDDNSLRVVDGEQEIMGRLVSSASIGAGATRFRVSTMGSDDESDAATRAAYDAVDPATVWNPVAEEFLVVWSGDDNGGALVEEEFEIFAQRVSLDGELLGDRVRVSAMGNDEETDPAARRRFAAAKPAVAVDPANGNYLVVWQGDDDTAPLIDDEMEIFGRILDADAGPVDGSFRISTTGDDAASDPAGRTAFAAAQPAVAFNPVSDNFVVTWRADDNRNGMIDNEHEIFAAQVSGEGALAGDAIRVSSMGPDGNASFDATAPAIAVEPKSGAVLIAWQGDSDVTPLVDDEFEIHARMLDVSLVPLDSMQQRVSSMGPDGETSAAARSALDATEPAVSWSPTHERFLVTWRGDTTGGALVDNEHEIFGRFLDSAGNTTTSEFRVSFMGDDEETDAAKRERFDAAEPAVAESEGAFIVVWRADSDISGSGNNRLQIFGRRVAETSAALTLGLAENPARVTAPQPVEVRMTAANTGSSTARNVRVHYQFSNAFPATWEGCDSVAENGDCVLGDLSSDESRTVTLVITTDHLELGDEQYTDASFYLVADTAIQDFGDASFPLQIPVALTVEGGNGAFGAPLLLLLGTLPWLASRRRRD